MNRVGDGRRLIDTELVKRFGSGLIYRTVLVDRAEQMSGRCVLARLKIGNDKRIGTVNTCKIDLPDELIRQRENIACVGIGYPVFSSVHLLNRQIAKEIEKLMRRMDRIACDVDLYKKDDLEIMGLALHRNRLVGHERNAVIAAACHAQGA